MFQYAAARALAIRNNAELLFDIGEKRKAGSRKFALDQFPVAGRIATSGEIGRFLYPGFARRFLVSLSSKTGLAATSATGSAGASAPVLPKAGWKTRLLDLAEGFDQHFLGFLRETIGFPAFKEKSLRFDPGIFQLTGNVYLSGFFQSEQYFKPYAPVIRKDLALSPPQDDARDQHIRAFAAGPATVALHVRRGDYLSDPSSVAKHGVLENTYFEAGLQYIRSKLGVPLCVGVFSEDVAWVKANIAFPEDTTVEFIPPGPPGHDYRDLLLISAFQHQIISNSTFSWWGAWLNANPDKIVVAPQQWYGRPDLQDQTRDLIPDLWIRL